MKRVALLAGLVALLWSLAACGDDDDAGSGFHVLVTVTATPSPTSSPIPTPPPSSPSTATSAPTPGVDLTVPPHTYAEALAHIAAGRPNAGETVRFVTPSDNIYCALAVDSMPAACELSEGTIDDPSACPDNPMTTRVGRIEFDTGSAKAVPICNSDTIRTPGAPVLDYGRVALTRDTECISEQAGVTCVSRAGRYGFFLHRGSYTLF